MINAPKKFFITFLLIVILLASILLMNSTVFSKNENYDAIKIVEGSVYVYEIMPDNESLSNILSKSFFESHVKDLNSYLDVNEVNYIITVQKDYWKAVSSKIISINGSDPLETGMIACKNIYIIIKVDTIERDNIIVNITLSMRKGYAHFGIKYDPLPITDTGWYLKNEFYVSYFNSLNMSKLLIIDRRNHDVKDLMGFGLGEWPFWLKDIKTNYDAVLYGLDDTAFIEGFNVTKPLSGDARIIVLNMTSSAPTIFSINNIHINPENQIYTNKGLLGSEIRILNVTFDEKEQIMDLLRKLDTTCLQNTGCREIAMHTVFPGIIMYDNNSIIIKHGLPNIMNFNDKPWTYINDAAILAREYPILNMGYHKIITIMHGIEYKGSRYITIGFPDLEAVSYDKNSKLLLYISVKNKNNIFGMLNTILPSVIVRAFGIAGFELTRYSELSMKLVNYEVV